MRTILLYLIAYTFRIAFWFRYRIKVEGYKNLTDGTLNKPGGVLFLPNHSAVMVDPGIVNLAVFPKFPIRPMVVEYMYYTPFVHGLMKFLRALPVPDFESSHASR